LIEAIKENTKMAPEATIKNDRIDPMQNDLWSSMLP
jgi:hypothetical protein